MSLNILWGPLIKDNIFLYSNLYHQYTVFLSLLHSLFAKEFFVCFEETGNKLLFSDTQ